MMAESTVIRLPSCVTCGFASAVAIFCLGLGSGAAGGLLLGMMAVTVLQSLELLADNRPLMNQLELYIVGNDYYLEQRVKEILQWENYNEVHGIHISMFAELFGLFSSAFSLAAGIFVGSSTYALVVKILGEAEVGKALASAGSVCLTVVTAIGYALGPTLEGFLTSTLNVSISMWFMISVAAVIVFLVICVIIEKWFKFLFDSYKQNVLAWLSFTPSVTLILFLATFFSNTRLILSVILIYTTMMFYLNESHFTKISAPSVPLMLIIADVFNIAGQPIVPSQAPAPTNTSSAASTNTSAVLESIFIGVLTTQMSMAAIGASLFASLHQGESWKICATATAAGSGTTVLGVIKFLLPALGPGPTIGALMGVAWAVGVTLAAAEAATDEYGRVVKTYGVVGKVGVTVGAAVGAFLYSLTHSGLSRWFMALCAVTIPAGHTLLVQLSLLPSRWLKVCLCIYLLLPIVLVSFTYTGFFYILFMKARLLCLYYLVMMYVIFFYIFCPPVKHIDGHRTSKIY